MTTFNLSPSGDLSGATDTANFQSAYNAAVAGVSLISGFSVYSGSVTIALAGGTYYINASSAMMANSGISHPTAGLRFQGAGGGTTTIIYDPAVSGPLCTNNFWLIVRFDGINFYGKDPDSDFLDSNSSMSSVQDYRFTDCSWGGAWKYACYLTGVNNNSEWRFNDCSATTTSLMSFLYVPAVGASDQFLNFWFSKFKFWSQTGNWIDMSLGGSIAITDCDVSNWQPAAQATFTGSVSGTTLTVSAVTSGTIASSNPITSSASGFQSGTYISSGSGTSWTVSPSQTVASGTFAIPTYLFNFPVAGHSSGVCTLKVDKLRVEYKSDTGGLISSFWNKGNISFNQVDESSQSGSRSATNLMAFFNLVNNAGPTISFSNSQLSGMHAYAASTNNFNYNSSIEYHSCALLKNPDAATFVATVSGGNHGGNPLIRFDKCIWLSSASGTFKEVIDCDVNWSISDGGVTTTKSISLLGSNSDWPFMGGTYQWRLPLNSIITRIRFFKPSGGPNTGAFTYTLVSNDASITLSLAGGWTGSASGGYPLDDRAVFYPLISDNMRTFTLTDAQPRAGSFTNFYCVVDYIG